MGIPTRVAECVRTYLRFPEGGYTLMAPFLGSGRSVLVLTAGTEAAVYGFERDDRAEQVRDLLSDAADDGLISMGRVVAGDVFKARISHNAVSMLYHHLPVWGHRGTFSQELQAMYLKHTVKYVAPGGVLVAVVPQLHVGAMARVIATNFTNIAVLRFPDGDFERFGAVAVFGYRKNQPLRDPETEERLKALSEAAQIDIPALQEQPEPVYMVPHLPTVIPCFTNGKMTEDEADQMLQMGYLKSEIGALLNPQTEPRLEQPALPLTNAHIAQLLATGALDGVMQTEDGPVLIRGDVFKETITKIEEDEDGTTIEREIESFKVAIRLLKHDGTHIHLT